MTKTLNNKLSVLLYDKQITTDNKCYEEKLQQNNKLQETIFPDFEILNAFSSKRRF